jgi:hypothetical protein
MILEEMAMRRLGIASQACVSPCAHHDAVAKQFMNANAEGLHAKTGNVLFVLNMDVIKVRDCGNQLVLTGVMITRLRRFLCDMVMDVG